MAQLGLKISGFGGWALGFGVLSCAYHFGVLKLGTRAREVLVRPQEYLDGSKSVAKTG